VRKEAPPLSKPSGEKRNETLPLSKPDGEEMVLEGKVRPVPITAAVAAHRAD